MARRPKADPNERDEYLRTPLMRTLLVGREDLATIREWLKAGADPNARDDFEDTPLHYAAKYGYANAIDILIEAGGDPNARSYDGRTPLMVAAEGGCIDAIHMLGSRGEGSMALDDNARGSAEYARDFDTMRALVGIGESLGPLESVCRELLVGAASRSDGKAIAMCEFLLSQGVDPTRGDSSDRLPEDLAKNPDARSFLRSVRESLDLAREAGESSERDGATEAWGQVRRRRI